MDPELRELRKQQWEAKRKREAEGESSSPTQAAGSKSPPPSGLPSTLPPTGPSSSSTGYHARNDPPSTLPPGANRQFSNGGGSDVPYVSQQSSFAPGVPGQLSKGSVSGTTGSVEREETKEVGDVEKVHILPVEKYDPEEHGGASAFRYLAKELKRLRANKAILREGRVLKVDESGQLFVIVKIEPEAGRIGDNSDFFFDGNPVARFTRVQFLGLRPQDLTGDQYDDSSILFSRYICPYLANVSHRCRDKGDKCKYFRILSVDETISVDAGHIANKKPAEPDAADQSLPHLQFVVAAAESGSAVGDDGAPIPPGMGIITDETSIYVDWHNSDEFDRIHVVPFQDTLPRVYNFDLFNDYLKPYFKANPGQTYEVNQLFTYHGVQFKVVACDPDNKKSRIGKNTQIHCEGVLHPSLRNLLPPELLLQLSYLPPGLQVLLLNTDLMGGMGGAGGSDIYDRLMELQENLNNRNGLTPETANQHVERITYTAAVGAELNDQTQCMICQDDFEEGKEIIKLPCNHIFDPDSIMEWLGRSKECPICKQAVDGHTTG